MAKRKKMAMPKMGKAMKRGGKKLMARAAGREGMRNPFGKEAPMAERMARKKRVEAMGV